MPVAAFVCTGLPRVGRPEAILCLDARVCGSPAAAWAGHPVCRVLRRRDARNVWLRLSVFRQFGVGTPTHADHQRLRSHVSSFAYRVSLSRTGRPAGPLARAGSEQPNRPRGANRFRNRCAESAMRRAVLGVFPRVFRRHGFRYQKRHGRRQEVRRGRGNGSARQPIHAVHRPPVCPPPQPLEQTPDPPDPPAPRTKGPFGPLDPRSIGPI